MAADTPQITLIYYSGHGHTQLVAQHLAASMTQPGLAVHLFNVEQAAACFDILHQSDMLVFGCPTYFGNVSAEFKQFMERTGRFWYQQPWKDKLAAGFTNSSTTNGDKLNTLMSLCLFAAQHSMQWVSLGILPRFICNQQTDGQNRLASYIGLMTQSDNALSEVNALHTGDQLTIELFGQRLADIARRHYEVNRLTKQL